MDVEMRDWVHCACEAIYCYVYTLHAEERQQQVKKIKKTVKYKKFFREKLRDYVCEEKKLKSRLIRPRERSERDPRPSQADRRAREI